MKTKTINTFILIIAILLLSNVSFSQSNKQNIVATQKATTVTQQSGYVTMEEVPTTALPPELINRVVLSYKKPNFERAYQIVKSNRVVGFEVEFTTGSKYNVLRYQLQN